MSAPPFNKERRMIMKSSSYLRVVLMGLVLLVFTFDSANAGMMEKSMTQDEMKPEGMIQKPMMKDEMK
jgi:hypothetical protein